MIKHLRHSELDKQKWDDCIARSHNTLVYAYSWYLDVVNPGWEALVEDDYLCVMPLTWRKKMGVRYLFQPSFTQKLGVFSPDEVSEDKLKSFIAKAKTLFSFAEINLKADNTLPDMPRHANYELNLDADYSQIVSSYHENTRRNLSKAQKNGLVVRDDVDINKVIELFDTDRRRLLPSFDVKSYETLRALSSVALDRGNAFIKGVSDAGGEIISAALFVHDGHTLTFLFSGNSIEGKQFQAMTFLVDSVIKDHCERYDSLDFEGSDDEGLARFYRGFGAELHEYGSLRFNNLPWFPNMVLSLWKKMKS
jgi:lipid II:glycine glycyltransferase (peptidoglycan interpeptide bridge formation enzyme)